MRSKDEVSSPVAVDVVSVFHGGGRISGPMMRKHRVKGALGSEDNQCKWNRQIAKQNNGKGEAEPQ
jgi:hypothetical protein